MSIFIKPPTPKNYHREKRINRAEYTLWKINIKENQENNKVLWKRDNHKDQVWN